MKHLKEYIVESDASKKEFFAETFLKSFENSSLLKEAIIRMFDNLDMDVIRSVSDYILKIDAKNYTDMMPSDDYFIGYSHRQEIIDTISEYILKFIVNAGR